MVRSYAKSICSIFSLFMESSTLEKSMNRSVALRFFPCAPLMIQWIAKIYKIVERFIGKSFSFFLRIFSTSGWIQLRL